VRWGARRHGDWVWATTFSAASTLAYAREDRRTTVAQPVGLRVVADTLRASHVDRLVVVDPHTSALESIFSLPVETTTAVPLLADALRRHAGRDGVDAALIAPDLGAAELGEVVHRLHEGRPLDELAANG
jgi:ribose-phosphate pyrophosphokinase